MCMFELTITGWWIIVAQLTDKTDVCIIEVGSVVSATPQRCGVSCLFAAGIPEPKACLLFDF